MSIALLATGNEIIHGDTLNTNSHAIAHAINSEGLELGLHIACSDSEMDIYHCIQFLASHHNVIIIIGGLGPTSDDRTRYALGRFLNCPLVEFSEAIAHIQKWFPNNTLLSESNKQQAKFPPHATLLPNPDGTAMGCYLVNHDKLLILLPGPPSQCLPMFHKEVLPLLQRNYRPLRQLLKWRLFGVAESYIADQLDSSLKGIDCETGYRWDPPYIECKIWFQPHLLETISRIAEPIVTPYIIATPEQKASEKLAEEIARWQQPILIHDDVTGGLLQTLLERPETYNLVTFYEKPNENAPVFYFHLYGLQEYWSQQSAKATTSVGIFYRFGEQTGTEEHTLPYRSALVVHFAAEWLSFRLLHLINQLHQRIT